jgi:ubiquinone/menaquinone biosynthesis C-methylase UbiE
MSTSRTWQLERDAAERYQQILTPAILGPAARALVEWSALGPGEAVLDAGCGTGAAARPAAERVGPTGRVIGIDVNTGMIDVARSLPPLEGTEIEWRVESIYDLSMPDAAIDVVLCAQTLQFLDQRAAAITEMRRVLRQDGRVALSCWCALDENPYFHALVEAVTRHIGADTAAGLMAAFGLSDPDTIRSLLNDAGLRNVEIDMIDMNLELPPLKDFVPRHISATPMATGFNTATERARRAVIDDVIRSVSGYMRGASARIPFRTHLARGVRP